MAEPARIRDIEQYLLGRGTQFEPGLSDTEVDEIQQRFGFTFPPDFREFLQLMVPIGRPFIDWRGSPEAITERLNWPAKGICFDICNNGYWREEWGLRPTDDEQATSVATEWLSTVPKLIPIAGHRYLPAEPLAAGNPVFSVYQTDIIHFGRNLTECLFATRRTDDEHWESPLPVFDESYRPIRFWTEMTRENL